MLEALRLEAGPPGLWPSPGHREKAQAMLKDLGWDPKTTLALLVDHPSILEDPDILAALAEAIDAGWTLVGLGTRATHPFLEALLCPLEDRALNLAGGMGLGSMAALLQCCGASLGGSPLLQSMAKACGCAPFPSNQAR
jgi:hypothetical protein